jgi:AraC-like DNA-binding protein
MQLLERGDRSISDIAVELGFYDQSHFTRHFTRIVGTTPGRFARRELRQRSQASADVAA